MRQVLLVVQSLMCFKSVSIAIPVMQIKLSALGFWEQDLVFPMQNERIRETQRNMRSREGSSLLHTPFVGGFVVTSVMCLCSTDHCDIACSLLL